MTITTEQLICTCDPLADEHCYACSHRHQLGGHPYMPYVKTTPLLAVEHVNLNYGEKTVLRDVNIRIRKIMRGDNCPGRVVAFLGPSGCGKSQLLRILAGLTDRSAYTGDVLLGEQRKPVKAGLVGLVSQQSILYQNRTVLGNLKVAAMQKDNLPFLERMKTIFKRRGVATERSMEILRALSSDENRTDLIKIKDNYPAQISGGQRQRIAIGQQLLCSEHFLLMDEPTASLDPKAKEEVRSIIPQVADLGDITIIVVTHDIPWACAVADTIWLMGYDRDANGKKVEGARIIDTYDLIECGLAWNPHVKRHPAYAPLVAEIDERFNRL